MTGRTEEDNRAGQVHELAGRWDRQQFAAQYQASYRTFWLVAAGVLGYRDGVEDVLQEAAVVALNKSAQFQQGTSFKAWMSQIVRFVALNHVRRRRRETAPQTGPDAMDQAPAPMSGPHASDGLVTAEGQLKADQSAFDDEVARALGELSDTARACLLLRTIEGLDYAEISKVLDIPEGTAMSHVHRSRQAMRKRLALREGRADRPRDAGCPEHGQGR